MKKCYFVLALAGMMSALASCEKDTKKPEQPDPELPKISAPTLTVYDYDETSFTVTWEEVENAGSYIYSFDNGPEMTISETRLHMEGLETDSYILKVKAVPSAPQLAASDYAEITITLGHRTNPHLEKWIGTWTATFSQSLRWASPDSGEEEVVLLDDDFIVDLVIAENTEDVNSVTVKGWYPPIPDATANGYVMADGTLILKQAMSAGEATEEGTPTWMSFCIASGEFGFVGGADVIPYSISMNTNEEATGIPYEGMLTDGRKYNVVNLGIYNDKGGGRIGIPVHGDTYLLPAGTVRMVRK